MSHPPTSGKLDPFHVFNVTYKVVNSTPIDTSILIPKTLEPGKHPVLVRWHGGFLIAGARLYMPFFPQWLFDFSRTRGAILIVPDYRLLPEASGLDILTDVADFWAWTRRDLPIELARLAPGYAVDLARLGVVGESAGGYLSVQSAFLHSEVGIKAVIASYPVLDVDSRFFSEAYNKPILGGPQQPVSVVDSHIASIGAGEVVAADETDPPSRIPLAISIVQNGRYTELLGGDERLRPFLNLQRFEGELPFIFAYHGREDSAVPAEGTEKWEELLKKTRPEGKWRVTFEPGDHFFDAEATLESPWLREGLEEFERYWR